MSKWPGSRRDSPRQIHDALRDEVLLAISKLNIGRFWLQETGAAYRDETMIRYGVLGGGDISGLLIGGRRVEIEIKSTEKARLRTTQRAFRGMIEMMGGIYIVARSVEDAVNSLITEHQKGK